MSTSGNSYCLDANVLIEAWQKYYSPSFCPDYWDVLISLGNSGAIFVAEQVYDEIVTTEDDLSEWLKKSRIPVRKTNSSVITCLKQIYSSNPLHQQLVDNKKGRSLADPWVIAHAMNEQAIVVTKEEKVTAANSTKIKIPNVCDNLDVRWINDFDFIKRLNIRFSCTKL